MGSGSSKEVAGRLSSSSSSSRGSRSRCARWRGGARAFASSCFRASSTLTHDQPEEQNGRSESNSCTNEAESKANQEDHESCRILRVSQVSKFPSLCASDIVNDGESQAGTSQTDSSASSRHNMHSSTGRSSSQSSRYRPRFGFISDGFGFSLNRAVSLGSSGVHSFFSSSLSESNCDTGDRVCNEYDSSMNSRNGTQVNVTMNAISSHEVVGNDTSIAPSVGECSQQSHSETESFVRRRSSRQLGHQEHLEGSARFSRTRSVGRLRDRVLRRTSNTEGLFGPMLLEYHSAGYRGQLNGRRASGHISRTPSSSSNRVNEGELLSDSSSNTPSLVTSLMEGTLGYDSETSQHREATDRHTLEHRSAFLERRRRIRSQVRALQRLGSRFENLSGHDRSCILSGQHRTGRCMCRTSNRTANLDDDTSTRASISRIVMLAEALFDVLDEIHQQSVVLSSQPSFSSIGSVPAPKEVVECMPVKAYMKPQRYQNEEAAQCYICLVEYEEGDLIRTLPCHHEFHQMCIDKWLKEIHRVCPLCRGDVCRSEFTSMEKF